MMKRTTTIIATAILCIGMAGPAMAQGWWQGFSNAPQGDAFHQWLSNHPNAAGALGQDPYQIYNPQFRAQHPELQAYLNNNPNFWNGVRSQGSNYYDERFQQFLNNHPGVARDLRHNPELMYDPRFRAAHPELNEFFAGHQKIWRSIRNEGMAGGPGRGWGAYDGNHTWRDYNWWHDNDRGYFWTNHPEWAANHPEWRDQDGDWDDGHHEWHDRDWWYDHHPDWVQRRHPNWWATRSHQEVKNEKHYQHEQAKEAKQAGKHQGHHDNGHGND
jgi:hypothetical protein